MVSDLDRIDLPERRVANVAAGMLSFMFVLLFWGDKSYCVVGVRLASVNDESVKCEGLSRKRKSQIPARVQN